MSAGLHFIGTELGDGVTASPAMPDIFQMARRTARRKKDHIDSHVIFWPKIMGGERFGSGGDPREASLIDRLVQRRACRPRLHLDEGDDISPARDQIYFSGRRPHPAAKDGPALEP